MKTYQSFTSSEKSSKPQASQKVGEISSIIYKESRVYPDKEDDGRLREQWVRSLAVKAKAPEFKFPEPM